MLPPLWGDAGESVGMGASRWIFAFSGVGEAG